jgi:hypothetical protein
VRTRSSEVAEEDRAPQDPVRAVLDRPADCRAALAVVKFDHEAGPIGLWSAAVDQQAHESAPSRAKAAGPPPIDALECGESVSRRGADARSRVDETHLWELFGQAGHFGGRVVVRDDDLDRWRGHLGREGLEAA